MTANLTNLNQISSPCTNGIFAQELQQVNSKDEKMDDFRSIWARIKGTSETITKLASCAVEKNEQNLTELRKLLVSLLSDATHLGLKDEILSSFLTEEEYFACRPGKKRKRKHDPQSEKVFFLFGLRLRDSNPCNFALMCHIPIPFAVHRSFGLSRLRCNRD
jgi:hypothetical protein